MTDATTDVSSGMALAIPRAGRLASVFAFALPVLFLKEME